jgi:class 3 adenylate cyclase/tetratricopeptide (TPR) repeat protein
VLCSSCNQTSPEGMRFCVNCGAALNAGCETCGAELVAGKPFCGQCGVRSLNTPVAASAEAPDARPQPVAERRLCSVLFVDLVGFTPLSETRDAEHVRELLSNYYERSQRIVAAYGGTIEKFIGDAVMAVWGAPVANEDDAERAVRAALEIVDAVAVLGKEVGIQGLSARGGVVTGETAITIGKVSEGMVLGDTVNTASRLQSAASPGTVLVDEATWRSGADAIAFEEVANVTLKGKSHPLRAWRALRVVAQRRGLGRTERLEPPFVGREEEIRHIKDLLFTAGREGRARTVSVTGAPGIGKSRLAWEFLKFVDGLADDVFWHQGRSRTFGEGVSFGALAEMVRMRAGVVDGDDAAMAHEKLSQCVARFVTDDEERKWVLPRMAHLLGIADAPVGDRDETFSAWRTFFERVAENGVTVMVFEDLQWADPGLVDFVESIAERSKALPILVITLSRPELMESRPGWGAGQRNFTSLHLDPLEPAAMRDLLTGFVHGLPESAIERVLARADGVPLYAVEMIRMLIDRGVLVVDGAGIRVEGSLDLLEIPETLQALVASRLDTLSAELRALIQDAAIVGSTFFPATVAVVNGASESVVAERLVELVRRELLYLDDDPRSPERGQFTFVQALIREVALSILSRRERATKHLTLARHLEARGDDDLVAIVAGQYAEAVRASLDAVLDPAVVANAVEWLRRAAERSLGLGSPREARSFYEEALELVGTHPERAKICEGLARAIGLTDRSPESIEPFMEAIALYRVAGDMQSMGRVTAELGRQFVQDRQREKGFELCSSTYAELGPDSDLHTRALLAEACAALLFDSDRLQESLEWSEVALTMAERLDDMTLFIRALGDRGGALFRLGRHKEAIVLAKAHSELAESFGGLREVAYSKMVLSLQLLPDDPAKVMQYAMEGAELCRRAGYFIGERTNLLNAAETGIYIGDWVKSRAAIDDIPSSDAGRNYAWRQDLDWLLRSMQGDLGAAEQLRASTSGDDSVDIGDATTSLTARALSALAHGDVSEAYRLGNRAVELDPAGINASEAYAVTLRAARWLGDIEEQRRLLELAVPLQGRMINATRNATNAAIYATEGRVEEALDLWRVANAEWRDLNVLLQLALTEMDMVRLLGPDHSESTVAKEAADIWRQLGATPFLEQLETLLSNT